MDERTDQSTPSAGLSPTIVHTTPINRQGSDGKIAGAATRRFRQRNEAARDRDVFRNLSAWESVYKPTTLRLQTTTSIESAIPGQQCPDKTLTTLARLCALQLNVRTCLVSLMCSETEYILADVTQSTPLQQRASNLPTESTWIGTTSFACKDGLSVHAVEEWQRARRARDESGSQDEYYRDSCTPHWFIIDDLRPETRYQDLPFLRRGPWIRFYCSVPLRSGQGSVIGALTVLDHKPRFGVSATEMTLLEELSDTIVQHLHTTITRTQQQRSERLLQGLSCFNNGSNTLRDWWLAHDDARADNQSRNTNQGTAADRTDRVDFEFGARDPSIPQASSTANADTESKESDADLSSSQSEVSPTTLAGETTFRAQRSTSTLPIHDAYNRATNLMREALGVDGVTFVSMNSLISKLDQDETTNEDHHGIESEQSDSTTENGKFCETVSYSTRQMSSIDGHGVASSPFKLQERRLQRLIKHYPHGSVFHFEADGKPQRGSDTESAASGSSDQLSAKKRRVSRDVEALGRVFKGVRSAAMYPMWDDATERWRSCAFVWSCSLTRILDSAEDLAYMRTFGHSILAEVSRLESVAADKAKTRFISTVSHELRSPLHAVLAGVEFLQDTDLDAFQQEMVNTVDMAGRTLLDTVDHILDYSKISNSTRASKVDSTDTKPLSAPEKSDEKTESTTIDLAYLTESTVETCVSAHRSQMEGKRPAKSETSVSHHHRKIMAISSSFSPALRQSSDVAITLNIAHRKHWLVDIESGAWTRILTNLVGNALKYTHKGHISVRLDLVPSKERSQDITETDNVLLVVEDTGIGMSEAFIADGVFVPFKQEDPHSTGTGLGLSIVRQIVKDMGADLKLETARNMGTRLTVRLPVKFMPDDHSMAFTEAQHSSAQLMVDRFHLLTLPEREHRRSDADIIVGRSVTAIAREWLTSETYEGIDVGPDTTSDITVCAVTERTLKAWQREKPDVLEQALTRLAATQSHILVLAGSIRSIQPNTAFQDLPLKAVFVHQPIGPRKLLRAIASDRDSTLAATVTSSSSPGAESHGLPGENTHPTGLRSDDVEQWQKEMDTRKTDAAANVASHIPVRPTVSARCLSCSSRESSGETSEQTRGTSVSAANTILLVEDNHINMKLLIALVKKLKVPHQSATDGREAVELYRRDSPAISLILMDMSMPVMDGFTATKKIREMESRRGLPRVYIAALTGVTDPESKALAFDCGVDDFYSKPVGMKELKVLLDKVKSDMTDASADDT